MSNEVISLNRYVSVFLAERAMPLRRAASPTIEMRFTRAPVDELALSYPVMICAPAAGRPAFRVGSWDRNRRELSEDSADDHTPRESKLGVYGEAGQTQSPSGEALAEDGAR
jgi:hypothetical protein